MADLTPMTVATILLALGGIGLYVASRAAADALAGGGGTFRPGRLALGHWVPVVTVACWAAVQRRADLSLGVLFGTSVAALSLAMGMITYVAPPGALPPSRRAWPFVMAAAMLVLVAGFTGRLSMLHAAMLLVLGAAILGVWRGAGAAEATVGQVLADLADPRPPPGPRERALPATQWVLAIVLAAAGAKAAVGGAIGLDGAAPYLRISILSAGVISPLLMLPMLATGTDLAQRGRSAEACSTLVGVAVLNLCALLPIVILLWHVQSAFAAPHAHTSGAWAKVVRFYTDGQPLPFPRINWRVDSLTLAVLGFALIPVSLGRWAIGRLESSGLILAYAAYLAAVATITVKS